MDSTNNELDHIQHIPPELLDVSNTNDLLCGLDDVSDIYDVEPPEQEAPYEEIIPGMYDLISGLLARNMEKPDKVAKERIARDVTVLPKNAMCGNCKYTTFIGINEVTQNSGVCEMWKLSDRLANFYNSAPCGYWAARSGARMKQERHYQEEVLDKLVPVCIAFQARSPGGKEKVRLPKAPKADEGKVSAAQALAALGIGVGFDEEEPNEIEVNGESDEVDGDEE